MTVVLEAGAKPLTQFTVPYKGTNSSVAAHLLTPDTLYQSSNVFLRQGKLRRRPGLVQLNTTIFDNDIIGGQMAVTPTGNILLAISKTQLYTLQQTNTTWHSDTIDTFAVADTIVDITFIESSSKYAAILANKGYPLKVWINGAGAHPIVSTTGQVPMASSVCTAARRIVALVPPHTVVWSTTFDYTSWPALASAGKLAQTNDAAIAVRSIGTLDFVVYKERSIYTAKAQAGSDASAFNIKFLQAIEGPASPHAIVDVAGTHYYMTRNGRIATFDGTSYAKWIADGLWLHLQTDIDPLFTWKIHGVHDFRLHTVTFYYPRQGDNGMCKGVVTICLPLEGIDLLQYSQLGLAVGKQTAAFLGTVGKPVSYGYEIRFNDTIDRSMLFTTLPEDKQSCVSDENSTSDDGVQYRCMIQTGLFPMPEMKHGDLTVEPFFERADGYGGVQVQAVTSDSLESESGTLQPMAIQTIDLNSNPVREYLGFNKPCRFFGLRYEWDSVATVRYSGSSVYGRVLG